MGVGVGEAGVREKKREREREREGVMEGKENHSLLILPNHLFVSKYPSFHVLLPESLCGRKNKAGKTRTNRSPSM